MHGHGFGQRLEPPKQGSELAARHHRVGILLDQTYRAVEILREKGVQAAAKRSDRATNQGVLEAYIHQNRIGVLVEINCETDFVANTDDFRSLAKSIALQIAAMNPLVVAPEDREGKE